MGDVVDMTTGEIITTRDPVDVLLDGLDSLVACITEIQEEAN